jgi:hypothetical protein
MMKTIDAPSEVSGAVALAVPRPQEDMSIQELTNPAAAADE